VSRSNRSLRGAHRGKQVSKLVVALGEKHVLDGNQDFVGHRRALVSASGFKREKFVAQNRCPWHKPPTLPGEIPARTEIPDLCVHQA